MRTHGMKLFIISSFLVLGLAINSFSQAIGRWSIGVSASPFADGISSALYLNRHFDDKWQVGAMPIFRYYSFSSTSQSVILGINVNSRFYPLNTTRVLPYVYGYTGYFKENFTYANNLGENKITGDYWNYSLGVGAQLVIAKGWSVDANLGYFSDWGIINNSNYLRSFYYSFGVFKRFAG